MEIFRLIFSPIEVNTYIISDQSGDCAIIDCGCYDKNESEKFTDFVQKKNLHPVLLLNTHCHIDHIFGNGLVLEKYNLGTFCCKNEEMNRKSAVQHAMIFGLTMKSPPEPAGFITDGQVISFGSRDLTALHVPGHTAGSMAFHSKKDSCVFTGDALFAGSIGRTDLPGGDYKTLIESIKSKLFILPPETKVYPGHGDQTTIEQEIKFNPYFK